MATWDEIYKKLKEKVTEKLQKEEITEGSIAFEKLLGITIKECLIADGTMMRKEVGRDEKRGIAGKNVLYRDDSITKLTKVRM